MAIFGWLEHGPCAPAAKVRRFYSLAAVKWQIDQRLLGVISLVRLFLLQLCGAVFCVAVSSSVEKLHLLAVHCDAAMMKYCPFGVFFGTRLFFGTFERPTTPEKLLAETSKGSPFFVWPVQIAQ